MEAVLKVYLKRKMKLSPSKYQCARQVTFGGVTIEYRNQRGDDERRVYLSPQDEKMNNFLDIQSLKSKTEIQCICGMSSQLKSLVTGLQLIYSNIQWSTANNVVFTWSADLEKEFWDMEKAIQEAVKLSPIDINKKLYAFVDSAVTMGTDKS